APPASGNLAFEPANPTAWANLARLSNSDPPPTGPQARHSSYLGRVKIALVLAAAAAAGGVGRGLIQAQDNLAARAKGRADAPVTVYEMADFQCPACRLFTVTVFPAIEREYIATGKVRWVFINL